MNVILHSFPITTFRDCGYLISAKSATKIRVDIPTLAKSNKDDRTVLRVTQVEMNCADLKIKNNLHYWSKGFF